MGLLVLLFFLVPARVEAQPHAYWGFVSTGPGAGLVGHGFLLFREDGDPFLLGQTYQYNLNVNISGEAPLQKKLEDIKLVLSKEEFFVFLLDYSVVEDRSIRLYELNLSETEIKHLLKLLEEDRTNPRFSEDYSYGLNENCVARPIQLINQVVTPERRLGFLGPHGSFAQTDDPLSWISEPFLSRFPFYIAQILEHHPLSRGQVKYYERDEARRARFLAATFRDARALAAYCGWSESTERTLDLYFALYVKNSKTLSLDQFMHLTKGCDHSKDRVVRTLVDLYQAADVEALEKKSEIYRQVNGLLQ